MKNIIDFSSWHVGIAAEAIVAGQFARLGYDVSVQYGANQPEYDLIISKGHNSIPVKVSVKGSKDGSWGLTQNFLQKGTADYHNSIDKWLEKHSQNVIFCLVQFKDVVLNEMPRIYLSTPIEISEQLKKSAGGRGDTILYEDHTWKMKSASGYGTIDKIPDSWKFSKQRIETLIMVINSKFP